MGLKPAEIFYLIILLFTWIGLSIISWHYLAQGYIYSFVDEINIWGKSTFYNYFHPENQIIDYYDFGETYSAIIPLFKTCLVLLTFPGLFLLPVVYNSPLFTNRKFLFYRVARILFGGGGICGIIAFNKFAQFMNELYGDLGFYHIRGAFNYGYAVFCIAIIGGFTSALVKIRVINWKKKDNTEIDSSESIAQQPQKKELVLPNIDSSQISHQEKVERIKVIVEGKKETSLSWAEKIALIPKEEITEIVTTDLGFVVLDGLILIPEEAKKRANRK